MSLVTQRNKQPSEEEDVKLFVIKSIKSIWYSNPTPQGLYKDWGSKECVPNAHCCVETSLCLALTQTSVNTTFLKKQSISFNSGLSPNYKTKKIVFGAIFTWLSVHIYFTFWVGPFEAEPVVSLLTSIYFSWGGIKRKKMPFSVPLRCLCFIYYLR